MLRLLFVVPALLLLLLMLACPQLGVLLLLVAVLGVFFPAR